MLHSPIDPSLSSLDLEGIDLEATNRALSTESPSALYDFLAQSWPIIEPSMGLIDSWHMEDICYVLQHGVATGQVTRLVLNIPPGHSKSNIVSVAFPAWMWLLNPKWRSLYGTYEHKLAERDSIRTRDVVTSDWYQNTFKPNWQLKQDSNAKHLFTNTVSGFRMATTVGGKGTGWRVDAVVADDPLNSIDTMSEAKRKRAIYWWGKAISNRLKNPNTGTLVVVMQRLHAEDLSGHLERLGGYEHMRLPSYYEVKRKSQVYFKRPDPETGEVVKLLGWEDRRTEEGELLFPALYGKDVLERARTIDLGSDGFAGQHQQRPTAAEGGMFKRAHWRFWKPDGKAPPNAHPRPDGCMSPELMPAVPIPALDRIIISLDCAFKDKPKNDYVCFLVIGVCKAQKFLLGRVKKRISFSLTLAHMRQLVEQWPQSTARLIEDKANGPAVIDTLSSEISGIIAIEPYGGKQARASAIQPQVEAGNVFLPEGEAWLGDFVDELAEFPNGLNDDQVDALSQALIWLADSPALMRFLAMSKL